MALTGSALGTSVANDIAYASLVWYTKGKALSQTTADKPLLKWLMSNKKSFGGGGGSNKYLAENVKGSYISDNYALQGFSEDDYLSLRQAAAMLQLNFAWKEWTLNLIITWTELLQDGVSVYDDERNGRTSEHSEAAVTRVTSLLEDRMEDFGESWSRGQNQMFWADGTADSKHLPGVTALINDTAAVGTVGSLNKATYSWWRQRVKLDLAPTADAAMVQFMNDELLQLRRYGGRPDKALCGSLFLSALRKELFAKGYFTVEGWQGERATDLGMSGVHITGIGKFEYDPEMDRIGMSKRCYIFDSRRIKFRPMEGELNHILSPGRPSNYLVFIHGIKSVGALSVNQLTCMGVYGIA